jgi:hypothetical protein
MLDHDFYFLYRNCDSFYVVFNICILGVLSSSNNCNLIFFVGSSKNKGIDIPNPQIYVISIKVLAQLIIFNLLMSKKKIEWVRFIFCKIS